MAWNIRAFHIFISSYKLLLFISFSNSEVSVSWSWYLKMLCRWVSGALDPESSSEGDSIMSVKRCVVQNFIIVHAGCSFVSLFGFLKTSSCCFDRGVWAMIAVYLAYSLLQAPSTWVLMYIYWNFTCSYSVLRFNIMVLGRLLIVSPFSNCLLNFGWIPNICSICTWCIFVYLSLFYFISNS